jgi:hypothetical protein
MGQVYYTVQEVVDQNFDEGYDVILEKLKVEFEGNWYEYSMAESIAGEMYETHKELR